MQYPNSVFYRVIDSIFRYKWRWIIPFTLVFLVALGISITRPKEYVATASIMVVNNAQINRVMGTENGYGWESPSQFNIRYFNNLLRDDVPGGFLDKVLQMAKLNPPIDLSRDPEDKRIGNILKGLSTNADNSEVFSIMVKWKNPQEAERIVRAFQILYVDSRAQSKQAQSLATVLFLNKQINRYDKQLRAAEKAVTDFKQTFNGNLPDQQSSQMEQLSLLQTELDTLNVSSSNTEAEVKFLQERKAKLTPNRILGQTFTHNESSAEKRLKAKQEEKGEYLSRGYKPDSTQIIRLDKTIARLQTEVNQEQVDMAAKIKKGIPVGTAAETRVEDNPAYYAIEDRLSDIESESRLSQQRRAKLKARIAEYQAQMALLPKAEQELAEKTRRSVALRTFFDDLMARKMKAELQTGQEKQVGLSELQKLGVVRSEATSSRKKLILLMVGACILGLILGAVAVVVSEWLDPTIRYSSDAQGLLGVPVLAALPDARDLRIRLSLPELEAPNESEATG